MRTTTLLPDVMPHLGGCPEPLALRELQKAANWLCHQFPVWRQSTSCSVSARMPELDIELPDGAVLVQLLGAHDEQGRPLGFTSNAATVARSRGTRPEWIYPTEPGVFAVTPISDTRQKLTISSQLAPDANADSLPDLLLQPDCRQALVCETLRSLMLMPGRAWSAPELAMQWQVQRDQSVNRAKLATRDSGMPVVRRSRASFF